MQERLNKLNLTIVSSADDVDGSFSCGEVEADLLTEIRFLEGRRSVWKASINEDDILLKIYYPHPKQTRDADAEWTNAGRLASKGLSVPKPYFKAEGANGEVVIGFEWISGGETLDQILKQEDASQNLFDQLFDLHRDQHQIGCYQSDNHLGNYLLSEGKLYMLDAGSFLFADAPLSHENRRNNLVMLLANIPLTMGQQAEKSLARYMEHCATGIDSKALLLDVGKYLPKAIQTRRRKYYKKTRRSCTEFESESFGERSWLACRGLSADLKSKLLDDPDQFFEDVVLLKDGNTCTVVQIQVAGKKYVLKRYNQKSFGYRLTHSVMNPRALRSWANGHVLNLFGIKTPRPLACLLIKSLGMLDRGYLLMEMVNGETLDQIDVERIKAPGSRIPISFVNRWEELNTLVATHGDMKASNFIVDEDDNLILIDLDGLKFNNSVSEHERRREKDMKRFMRNWQDQPELIAIFEEALKGAG